MGVPLENNNIIQIIVINFCYTLRRSIIVKGMYYLLLSFLSLLLYIVIIIIVIVIVYCYHYHCYLSQFAKPWNL